MPNTPMPHDTKPKRRRSKAERRESAETSRAYDARKREAGFVRSNLWVPKEDLADIKWLVETRTYKLCLHCVQTRAQQHLSAPRPVRKRKRISKSDPKQLGFDFS